MSVEYDDEIAKEFESLLAESRDPTATLASEHQYRSESAPPTVAAALSHRMSPPGFPTKNNHNNLRSDNGGMLLRSADDADTHTSLFSSSSQPIWQYKRVASSSSGFPAWQPSSNHVHQPSLRSGAGNSMLGLELDDKHTNHLQDGIGASEYFSSKNSKNLFGCRQDESLASSDNVNCLSQDPFVKEHHFSRSQTPPPSQLSSLESLSTSFSYLGGRYSAVDNSKISRHDIPSKASCGINESSDLRSAFSNLSLAPTRNLATCDVYDNLEAQNQALALENARSEVVGYSKVQRTQPELMSSVSSPQLEKPFIYAEDGIHHRNYKMPLDPPLSQVNDASMWKFSKPVTSEIYVPTFSALCKDKISTGEVQTGFNKNEYMPGHGSGGKLLNPMFSSVNSNFAVNDSNSYLFDETAAMKIATNSMNCKSRANGIDENLYKSFVHMERLGKLSHEGRHVAQLPNLTPAEIQYMQRSNGFPVNMDANFVGASTNGGYCTGSSSNLLEIQKLLYMQQKSQCSRPSTRKGSLVDIEYLCNSNIGPYMPYTKIPGQTPIQLSSHVMPHAKQYDRNSHNFSLNGSVSGTVGLCRSENRTGMLEKNGSSLLEEFKSNKNRNFQLSEIVGHVVEFSTDQFGSRFIQQKLETAPVEEKNTIFQEIFPESLDLMKDVFGNYVIQKFFEHGTVTQRRDLANRLSGHVLDLSLQMYGCRVIQKAIEVVETDQQERLVLELDGHIMRCVLDQNGNHVIQKGIECIPQEKIHFIISSFFGRVPELSSHAYGCRVIQRVLEHYNHEQTQSAIFEEILQAACTLAKDQYGNYVVQHVLGHGKPHERSAIIKKLAGQIVQMSHQKFASNVIEKCLEFGGPAERQILINEILGSTDDNEPLQAMMKDQYGNYVVQKALDTCDDQQRASILSRVKAHITALKKYTYGKHIVSHVEKLVAGGYM